MFDVGIIGCGITGAAIAFELSKYNLKIAIIEKENDVATGATKANSAIIHAGYDPLPGTLMAKLNVRGASLCKEICEKLDVPYQNCGALVFAFDENKKKTLEDLLKRGKANGVLGLRIIDRDEVLKMESETSDEVVAALYAPTSSIVSPWEMCLAMAETAVKNGAEIFLENEVKDIKQFGDGYKVITNEKEIECKYLVNAAGLYSDKIHDMVAEHEFDIVPSRGQYFLLDKIECQRAKHTIFQCPSKLGKGVLVSPTVHGNLIVGPDSEIVEGENKATTKDGLDFVKRTALRSIKSIDYRNSIRNFAGVRARTKTEDFIIGKVKGADHFIDAAGMCSPGLSSAPAVAEYVASLLSEEGLVLKEKENFIFERKKIRFKNLSVEQKQALVKANPAYGKVVCRCETITEGEILDCFNTPIPPRSVDGVKRRVSAGMGRCQGGFCGPMVLDLLAKNLGIDKTKIVKEGKDSYILSSKIGK